MKSVLELGTMRKNFICKMTNSHFSDSCQFVEFHLCISIMYRLRESKVNRTTEQGNVDSRHFLP